MDEDILNVGLELAMAFGEDWLQPIQARLARRFPALSRDALDGYNQACQKAMTFGHEQVARRTPPDLDEATRFERFRAAVLAEFPWVKGGNLRRLFSQGCYYAMK